jgi:hypothetical protein
MGVRIPAQRQLSHSAALFRDPEIDGGRPAGRSHHCGWCPSTITGGLTGSPGAWEQAPPTHRLERFDGEGNAGSGSNARPVGSNTLRSLSDAGAPVRFTQPCSHPARACAGKTALRTTSTSHATEAEPAQRQRNLRLIAIGRPDKREADEKCFPAARPIQEQPKSGLPLSLALNLMNLATRG